MSKREQEESWHRQGSYIIFRALGGKQQAEKIWPIGESKSTEKVTQVIDPELYRKIMEKATGHKKNKDA